LGYWRGRWWGTYREGEEHEEGGAGDGAAEVGPQDDVVGCDEDGEHRRAHELQSSAINPKKTRRSDVADSGEEGMKEW
jgi:hypothetical protein